MNPPERHLQAVPDAPTTQRRGKSKTLEDARSAMVEDQAAVDRLKFERGEKARAALAEIQAKRTKPAPGPHAQAHMGPYRRGGKRRKRELRENREALGPILTVQREATQRVRRAQRAARG